MASLRARTGLLAAIVAAVALAVHANSVANGFALDDPLVIEENPLVTSHDFLGILAAPYHTGPSQTVPTGLYRPLATLTFALDHAAGGLDPRGYHAVNVALHALVSALVLLLGVRAGLERAAALAGALLFAVHPIHSEAVANVSGRAELLSAALFLLALLVFARGREPGGRLRLPPLAAAAALSFLAMLSKEHAVTFVGAAAAWEALVRRPAGEPLLEFVRRRAGELSRTFALLALPALGFLAARRAVLGSLLLAPGAVTPIENPAVGLPFLARTATAVAALGRYALLFVFPLNLSPDHGVAETGPVRSPLDPWFLAGLACVLALAAVLAAAWRRSRPVALSILAAAVPFSIVSNVPFTIGTILAERLLYLPSAGLCLLAGAALPPLARLAGWGPAWLLAAALLCVGSARTVSANAAWKDDFTLYSRAVGAAPRSVRVLGNLAVELAARGRPEEAVPLLERAVLLAPDFAPNRINLAGALLKRGELAEAEAQIRHVLAREPAHAVALLQLGAIRARRGEVAGAREAFERALSADPKLSAAREALARLDGARPSD
jgi:hypothetical protein